MFTIISLLNVQLLRVNGVWCTVSILVKYICKCKISKKVLQTDKPN